jgi:exopolysaccharide biosynthesis polyprenyl glycosylphosphotransferase
VSQDAYRIRLIGFPWISGLLFQNRKLKMKVERRDMFYSLLLLPVDAVALLLAGLLTWYLRFKTDFLGLDPAGTVLSLHSFFIIAAAIIPAYLIIFAIARLYVDHREQRYLDELFRVLLGLSTGTLGLIVFLFFRQEVDTSRFLIIATWILAILFVAIGRYGVRIFERIERKRGIGVHKVIIIGENDTSRRLRRNFREHPEQGVQVVAVIGHQDAGRIVREIAEYLETHQPSEVIQTDPTLRQSSVEHLLDFCDEHRLRYKFTPNIFETQATNIGLSTVAGIPIVELKHTPLEGWGRIGKRSLDLAGSGLGILVLSPILIALALAVKIGSRGPVFYRQERVDRDQIFRIYKFRSMYLGADQMLEKLKKYNERSGPLFKIKNDPRVTPVGRFIRKTSLDELAQLINVLKGDMSLVGPRPHLPSEIARYKKHHRKLLRIKPGITGLAAISGRSDLDFEDEVRLDTYYIEHWSLLLDLKILLRTIPVVLARRSAA